MRIVREKPPLLSTEIGASSRKPGGRSQGLNNPDARLEMHFAGRSRIHH